MIFQEQKIVTLRDLLMSENTMKDETRKHLVQLSTYTKKRKSSHLLKEEEYGNDINSTGSFLSDLSLTQSGDDFLDSKLSGTHQKWKKHRPSYNNNSILNMSGKKTRMSMEKRRSTRQSLLDYGPNDKIVAQTKVTIPNDKRAPIIASSTIESIPYNHQTPSSSSGSSTEHINIQEPKLSNEGDRFKTPLKKQQPQSTTKTNFYTPSAPSLEDLDHITEDLDTLYATVKKRPMGTLPTRLHKFASKTFLKPETCAVCQKRIRFGSAAYKCSECRTCAHQDCREKLTVSCLPQSASATNSKTGSMGIVGDYTPNVSPMIPALIVHCVNEIEMRGLTEIGLYRVSGGDREVKALKERFLRNKGIPYLNSIDIHVLCGCIKDFLRSLREPLIPLYLWTIFSNASQNVAEDDKDVYQAIDKLPQPNRDTLAYLIQHFQRIAECPAVKMPLTNFAKIFGPTIVGYTCSELDQHKIFAETQIQYNVMFSLLSIPTDYWNQFVNLDAPTKKEEIKAFESYGSKFYSGKYKI